MKCIHYIISRVDKLLDNWSPWRLRQQLIEQHNEHENIVVNLERSLDAACSEARADEKRYEDYIDKQEAKIKLLENESDEGKEVRLAWRKAFDSAAGILRGVLDDSQKNIDYLKRKYLSEDKLVDLTTDEAIAAMNRGQLVRAYSWRRGEWIRQIPGGTAYIDEKGKEVFFLHKYNGPDDLWEVVDEEDEQRGPT